MVVDKPINHQAVYAQAVYMWINCFCWLFKAYPHIHRPYYYYYYFKSP